MRKTKMNAKKFISAAIVSLIIAAILVFTVSTPIEVRAEVVTSGKGNLYADATKDVYLKVIENQTENLDEQTSESAALDSENQSFGNEELDNAFTETSDYLAGLLKGNEALGTEWVVLSLARADRIADIDTDAYYNVIVEAVESNGSAQLAKNKSTENSRVILALTAIGKEVTDVGGYNLLEPLADLNFVTKQGLNGAIWALIALDSHDYEIPLLSETTIADTTENEKSSSTANTGSNAEADSAADTSEAAANSVDSATATSETVVNSADSAASTSETAATSEPASEEKIQTTRENLVQTILDEQLEDGGFAMSGTEADPDMTAMAIQSLANYKDSNDAVNEAIEKAVDCLSNMQDASDGGFMGSDGKSSETCAQVIVALAKLGIDPSSDERFVKDGKSVVDALLGFYVEGGGFEHVSGGGVNGIASEQGFYSLVAYSRMLSGKTSLYDMSDVEIAGDSSESGETATSEQSSETEGTDTNADTDAKSLSKNSGAIKWLIVIIVIAAAAIVAGKLFKKERTRRK